MSGLLTEYLGAGPVANRPETPNIVEGALALYHAEDEGKVYRWNRDSGEAGEWELLGVQEAPSDGESYLRKDGGWEAYVAPPAPDVTEAPEDGESYVRKDGAWEQLPEAPAAGVPEAPEDGTGYVRKDGGWVAESGGGDGGGSADYPPFVGNAGKILAVNGDEDGVEWVEDQVGSGGGGICAWSNGSHDKRGMIGVTATGTYSGDPTAPLAGYPTATFFWGNGNLADPKNIVYDFRRPNKLQGIAYWQDAGNNNGVWTLAGSHDNATWTDIINDLQIGGAQYSPAGVPFYGNGYIREFNNDIAYRYYRVSLNAGSSANNNPYISQTLFKCQPIQ